MLQSHPHSAVPVFPSAGAGPPRIWDLMVPQPLRVRLPWKKNHGNLVEAGFRGGAPSGEAMPSLGGWGQWRQPEKQQVPPPGAPIC